MGDVIRFPKAPVGLAPNMLHVCAMMSPACADDVCEACDDCGCECHPEPHDSQTTDPNPRLEV